MTVLLAACPDDPKPAVGVNIVAGNTQSAIAGTAVPVAPTIKVVDEDGKGVGGATFTFTVMSGGGSIATSTGTVGADGTATPGSWTLGKTAGFNVLSAVVEGIGTPQTFTATGIAGPAASATASAGNNQTTAAGSAVAITPQVKVVDANGNAVQDAAVTFAVASGGGTITGATAATNQSGFASVGSWTLGATVGTQTLTATVSGVAAPITFTATATALATKLVINTQPANATSGTSFGTQPVVSIRDANNNVVTSSNAAVTAAIGSGTGTLSGTTTVNAVGGVATFANLAVTGTTAVTLTFSATGLASATSNSFTPAAAAPFNLKIDGMYLTQATQSYAGGVPLIANRAALLRVFVKSTTANTVAPAVKVTTFQNGAAFKTYTIPAPGGSVPQVIDEGVIGASWNVNIPASEVVSNMSILAEVDPTNAIAEDSETDNKFPVSGTAQLLDVRTPAPMRITFVPVTQGGGTGDISATNVNAYLEFPLRVYPWVSSTMDIQYHAAFSYATTLVGTSYDAGWTTLLSQIAALRQSEGITDRYYYAVIKPSYSSGGTGFGQVGGGAAIGVDVKFNGAVSPATNYYSMTLAHELGHNFGRQHVDCGGPSGIDINYPYDPKTSIGVFGWDPASNVLRGKDAFTDFMSYCNPLWISDYTYKAVIAWRESHYGPPAGAAKKSLLVWGRIGPSGIVLEPAFEIDAAPSLPERAGRYSVQAVAGDGREIFNISFDGYEVDHASGERNFAYVIPLPATGQISELRLRDRQTVMARRSRTTLTNAPASGTLAAVRLRSLTSARSRLEWDATTYPMAMVRDPQSGQVLGFLTGGSGDLGVQRPEVDVLFSNGVSSVKQRVQITR